MVGKHQERQKVIDRKTEKINEKRQTDRETGDRQDKEEQTGQTEKVYLEFHFLSNQIPP
jgi:hypothetical protein